MPETAISSTQTKPRDIQTLQIAAETLLLRSRSWGRLRFEIEYALQRGTTANSYLIEASKTALFDPPGESFTEQFITELQQRIDPTKIDYVILGHINPNRAETLKKLLDIAPQTTFVCSNPGAISLRSLLPEKDLKIKVMRGEENLNLGQGHRLLFTPIPTPRWPDGLATYDTKTQILFCDKFFGAHVCGDQIFDEGWTIYNEDRRYYFDSLMAPQASQVGIVLDRLEALPPAIFYAPGHGPLVRYGMHELTGNYRKWSQQQATQTISVALIYASAYGNTAVVGQAIASGLTKAGIRVESINCEVASAEEIQAAVERCSGFIIGSPTLGGHAPTQVQTALGIVLSTADKSKPCGVFGSFGWSGEAIDLLENKLQNAGYELSFEPIRVKFKPTDVTLKMCEEVGINFAQALKRSKKFRPAAQPANNTEQAVGRIIGSLCVLTAKQGDVTSAMLASWVSQATFNPPGLTVAVAKDRAVESMTHIGDSFAINILQEGKQLRKHFMKKFAPGEDRFTGLEIEEANNESPVLKEALAYLECTVRDRMECGDHWVVYATIDRGQVNNADGKTAVHHRKSGSYY